MATVNIRRDVTDPFYRYKMEKIQSKIEGKGNGIKTVIVNLTSVSHSLAREPGHIIKYFGFELGAQTNTNPADDRWIINGAHEATKLQDHLDGFISKFVLCKKCKNPETDPTFPEGRIVLKCKACGERSDVDLRLKLSSFILKNIPKKGKKDKATKKAERKARKERENNGNDDGSNGGSPNDSNSDHAEENGEIEIEANSDDELTRRINSEAKQIEIEEEKEVEWTPAIDTSEAAVKARALDLPDDFKTLAVANGDHEEEEREKKEFEKKELEKLNKLRRWILDEVKVKGDVDGLEDVDIYVKAKSLKLLENPGTLEVLAQTIFDDTIVEQIEDRSAMLKQMMVLYPPSDDHRANRRHLRHCQKALLYETERFIDQEKPELAPQVINILMAYYDNDLVSEKVFKAWGTKVEEPEAEETNASTKQVKFRKAAGPFLKWLDEADVEEEKKKEEKKEEEKEEKEEKKGDKKKDKKKDGKKKTKKGEKKAE